MTEPFAPCLIPERRDAGYPMMAAPRIWCESLAMKIRDVIKLVEADGWFLTGEVRGSHVQVYCRH
jgi:hypothetical protein